MQKRTAAIYECCMCRCTVHYNLPQDPFFMDMYYFFSTNDILSFSPTKRRFNDSLPN